MKFIKTNDLKKLFGVLGRLTGNYMAGLIGSSIAGASSTILLAYILRNLVDAASQKSEKLILKAVVLTVSVCVVLCVIMPVFEYIFNSTVKKIITEFRKKCFRHVTELKIRYFEDTHSADILSRINNDMNVIENCYSQDIKNVLNCIILGVGTAIFMLLTDVWISVTLMIVGGLTLLINSAFAKTIRRISGLVQQKTAVVMERFSDILSGFQIIKIFGIRELFQSKFEVRNQELTEENVRRSRINSWLDAINHILYWCNFGGVITIGILMGIRGTLDFGKLIAIIQLMNGVVYMFQNLGGFITKLQTSLASMDRVMEILDAGTEPERLDMPPGDLPDAGSLTVLFDNVTFSYGEGAKNLDGFTLAVKPGEVAALAGVSGGGKSTVLKLLMGFYPADSGGIYINGRHIGQYSLDKLRNQIAYVSQDSFLFNASIRENIRYGRPDASDEEIENAARLAYAHEFIMEQPAGYETVVGENGASLSGGQKQRISIARAFLKNAPVLLLDEATSSLDSKSEELVQEALSMLMKDRTTIVIAHRLSTIEKADSIYVVENGRIVEKGSHHELLENGGVYSRLYNMQFVN